MIKKIISLSIICLFLMSSTYEQELSPKEIIQKANDRVQGKYSEAEIKMTIIRPNWSREMKMKTWSSGSKYSLILITSPARDRGISFLKRGKEMWDWRPNIERVIKMPPSMMSQNWMGSDFTNDDLTKGTSLVEDFTHKIVEETTIEDRNYWVLELLPKEDVPVIWGKIKIWIDKKDFIQMKTEFYDEDDYLVQTIIGKDIQEIDGKLLPKIQEVIPEEEEGYKTRIEYLSLTFDKPIKDSFFTIQNMKRVR